MGNTEGTREWSDITFNFRKGDSGCPNVCKYCYARGITDRYNACKWEDWGTKINWREDLHPPESTLKAVNRKLKLSMRRKAKQVLKEEGELPTKEAIKTLVDYYKWNTKPEDITIMSPSTHDLFPSNLRLAYDIYDTILQAGYNLLIVTKPNRHVVEFLADRLDDYKEQITWRFSIGSIDNDILRYWEPNASSFESRLHSLVNLHRLDYKTSISMEPFLDFHPEEVINKCWNYVTEDIWIGPLNTQYISKHLSEEDKLIITDLTSKETLLYIKKKLDKIRYATIKYKDHFLKLIE